MTLRRLPNRSSGSSVGLSSATAELSSIHGRIASRVPSAPHRDRVVSSVRSGTKSSSALGALGVVLLAACAQTPPPTSDSPHPIVARPDASAVDAAPLAVSSQPEGGVIRRRPTRYALAIRFRATRDGDRLDLPIGFDALLVALRFGPGGKMGLHLRNVPSHPGVEWLSAPRGH